VREASGLAAGDEVLVQIEVDTAEREVTVPTELAEALDRDPTAKRAFDKLSYSNRKRHVLAVEGAKTEQTRQRRIARALDELRSVTP